MKMLLVLKTEAHISDKQVQKSYNKTESNIRNPCYDYSSNNGSQRRKFMFIKFLESYKATVTKQKGGNK